MQVTFKGDGILGGIQVISDVHGNVKGKVGNPAADPPLRPDGKLNVGCAVGRGGSSGVCRPLKPCALVRQCRTEVSPVADMASAPDVSQCMACSTSPRSIQVSHVWCCVLVGVLAVVRSNVAQDKPYTGLTEIKSGEVAEDLAAYLADSEQTNSALALGVSISRDASVRAAGGYLVQVHPDCLHQGFAYMQQRHQDMALTGSQNSVKPKLEFHGRTHSTRCCLRSMAAKCLVRFASPVALPVLA